MAWLLCLLAWSVACLSAWLGPGVLTLVLVAMARGPKPPNPPPPQVLSLNLKASVEAGDYMTFVNMVGCEVELSELGS